MQGIVNWFTEYNYELGCYSHYLFRGKLAKLDPDAIINTTPSPAATDFEFACED